MRRRNFYLPDELMEGVKKIAEKRGVSMTEILKTALEAYLRAVSKAQEAKNGA